MDDGTLPPCIYWLNKQHLPCRFSNYTMHMFAGKITPMDDETLYKNPNFLFTGEISYEFHHLSIF